MSDAKYRAIFLGLGVAFLAVILAGFVFGSPEAEDVPLPGVLEEISPLPGSQVPLQVRIEVDVPIGYRIEMFVDNFRVPETELQFVEGTGVYSFVPSRSEFIAWGSGEHSVLVRWRTISGLPDEGEFRWTFRTF